VKGKAMSKIYEALENAEKERLRKGPSVFPGPKVENKPELVLGPKEQKKTAIVPGSKEERMGRPEENAEKQRATELGKGSTPAPEPKEEKKTAPVPEPKGLRVERHQIVFPPKMVRPPIRPDRTKSDHPLVSIFQPGSLGAEQFRKLRTQVVKLNVSDPPKTIMVTSATAGEGKTFVAANLAAGIAHDLHFHALLVDCDLRNPSLSHWFGVQNGHGLSDYLVGRGQLSELLMKTEMEKLHILTGGSAQAKPAELIGSRKMEALIQELRSRYNDRYIILDATPLLATAEPEVLARLVDGILIVVRANVTPRETVKQAIASLDPKKILGFVLNDVEFKSHGLSSRYFGSDGYYTQYGYEKKGAESRSPSGGTSPFKKKSG
jgi:protein-tyrosine kinase